MRGSLPVRLLRAAGLASGLVLSGPARAADELRLDPQAWPLSSIGRVNVVLGANRRAHCTGTLVGANQVLTAAHCLYDPARARWVHPSSVHFVAGYARGEYRAQSVAEGYAKGDFAYAEPPEPAGMAQDWAVLRLADAINLRPLRVESEPSASARPDRQAPRIVRAGYRGDRAHVLTLQKDCSMQVNANPALLLNDCGGVPGESGSALLRLSGEDAEVIGILVAGAKQQGGPAIAVPARTFRSAIQ